MLAPGRGTRGSWVLAVTSRAAGGRPQRCAGRDTARKLSPAPPPPAPAYPSRALPALLLPRTLFIFFIFSFCLEMNLNGPEEGQLQERFDCKDLKVLT